MVSKNYQLLIIHGTMVHWYFIIMLFITFLAHLSRRLKVRYCDHSLSVRRLSVHPQSFTQHLLLNHWLEFDQTSQEWSLVGPLSKLFKWFRSIAYLGSQELKIDFLTKKLKNLPIRSHWTDFHIIFQKCFLWWPSTKIVQAIWIHQKTWPPGGGAYFP